MGERPRQITDAFTRLQVTQCSLRFRSLTAAGLPHSPAALSRAGRAVARTSELARYRHHRDLLRDGDLDRLLSEGPGQHQRRILHGRPRDDGVDCGPELRFRQSGIAGTDGLGRIGVSVRHSGRALVLGRRDPRDAFPGHRDDAVLLRLQDALRARLSEASLRAGRQHGVGVSRSPS